MKSRTALLILIIIVLGALAFLNFPYLVQSVPTSLGFTTLQAPLGLILMLLTAVMVIVFIAYVIAMQGSWLLESRAHTKEMAAQRDLAEKAEVSRIADLRAAIESLHKEDMQKLMARLDEIESRLNQRAQESDNSTAAYVGQLEEQLRTLSSSS